jgi:hypothetical protein
MARYYKLISSNPPAYITEVDRKALVAMLSTGSVRATTARKSYQIRVSCDLDKITERIENEIYGSPVWMPLYRSALDGMKKTIQKEQEAGRVFYEMIVNSTTGEYYKIHFFA